MFGLQMLDVMIGLVFIYILLALACTVTSEMIAGFFDSRTKNLRRGIYNLLGELPLSTKQNLIGYVSKQAKAEQEVLEAKSHVAKFYNHALIKTLNEDGTRPSYIPAKTFARVIVDMFAPADGTGAKSVQTFTTGVNAALGDYPDLQRNLLILVDESKNDMDKLTANIEDWFNNAMDRVSAWYKNKSQVFVLVLSLLLSTGMNADSIQLAKSIYNDGALRTALVAQAQEFGKKQQDAAPKGEGSATTVKTDKQELEKNIGDIRKLGLKLGWDKEAIDILKANKSYEWLSKIAGILITALAVSLGAPFWFDMLNKLASIRSVGKSPNEKSKTK